MVRRQEGSHVILRRSQPFAQVVVPEHKELDRRNAPSDHSSGWSHGGRVSVV